MTKEIIEDFRFIVIPYMVNRFKEINYEGQGGSDAEEFKRNFNEICVLANKALEQEPTTKNYLAVDKLISDCEKMSFDMEIFNKPLKVVALDAVKNIVKDLPSVKPQEPKIKVLERDEAMRKLGAVDIYQARAWITLLNDLEYLKLKICEVEE